MTRGQRLFALLAGVMVVLAVVLVHGETGRQAPVLVEGARSTTVAAEGVVEPASGETVLAAPITGTIGTIAVAVGQRVAKGQLIAVLKNDDLQAELRAARDDLVSRRAALEKLEHGARAEERAAAAAVDRGSRADVQIASTRLTRIQTLADRGFATRANLDEARYGAASAAAKRDQAAQQLMLINAPPRYEDVTIARANVRAAENQVANAAAQLAKAEIRAPFAGTILSIPARTGEATSVLQPTIVATMGDINVLHVAAEVDEAAIDAVRVGQPVRVVADAFPNRIFSGRIVRLAERMTRKAVASVDPQAQQDALTLKVTVALAVGTRLPIGLRCDVFIETSVIAPARQR